MNVHPASAATQPAPQAVFEVSVVMPCLNEAETIERCVLKAMRALRENGISGEVIVSDNGSTDGSPLLAEAAGARVVFTDRKGYGAALMCGITAASGSYVVMADADDSYDFSHLPRFVERLREGADLVVGNRFRGGIRQGAMPPLHRYLGNPVLTFLGRLFFKAPCGDFHCGMRAFRKDSYDALGLRTLGMEFASEMVVKATLLRMDIAEVPTTLSPDGRNRAPHLRTWRDGWRHLRFLLMYSPRWLFLYPGLAMMAAGMFAALWLASGTKKIGGISLDVHTMTYALAAVSLGYQAVLFGACAKVFAITEGLLPKDEKIERLFKHFTLETGLVAGGALVLSGIGLSVLAVWQWAAVGFGPLDGVRMMRVVGPAVIALSLGFETVLASFFLSILGLRRA